MTNLTPVGSTCIAVNSNSNDLLQKLDIEDMDEGDNDFAMDGHDQDHDSMKKYTEVKFSRFILFGDDSDVEGTDEEDNNLAMDGHNYDVVNYKGISTRRIPRVTIYLRLDSLPEATSKETGETSLVKAAPSELVEVHGLRLLESNDWSFSAKKSSADDPVVNSFLTFGRRHNLASSGNVLTGPGFLFGGTLAKHASGSDFLVVPWSNTGDMSEHAIDEDKNTKNELGSLTYTYFVNQMLAFISVPVAIFIDRNFEGRVSLDNGRDKAVTVPVADRSYHIFFPYFGGKDDMTALNLVLQLAENSHVTATVVHFNGAEAVLCTPISRKQDTAFFASHRASLPLAQADRVIFETVVSEEPVADVIARARTEIEQSLHSAGDLIVLGMNVARNRVLERKGTASTLGVLADRVLEGKLGASVLVVKA